MVKQKMSYVVSSVVIKMIRKIDLTLFRMVFLGAAGGGGKKSVTHDEFWYT